MYLWKKSEKKNNPLHMTSSEGLKCGNKSKVLQSSVLAHAELEELS